MGINPHQPKDQKMKLINTTDHNPFDLLDQFFDIGLNGANNARHILKPLTSIDKSYDCAAPVRVHENDDSFQAQLDMPGVKKEDVHIEINDGKLHIQGTRKDSFGGDGNADVKIERTLRLGDQVDPSKIQATLVEGVLGITLPKKAKSKTRTIKVK